MWQKKLLVLVLCSAVPVVTTSKHCCHNISTKAHTHTHTRTHTRSHTHLRHAVGPAHTHTHLEGCIQIRIFTNSQWAPRSDKRSCVLKERGSGVDPEGWVCVLRGGKEEQTPGASVSGLRPWRQGLAALTEVATNADVQTPLAHTHTPGERSRMRRRGGEEEKERGS